MKIKDIMTKNVVCVDVNENISKIAQIMEEHRIHGVPVLKKGKLVGIITETDFFVRGSGNFHLPTFINFIKKIGIVNKNKKEYKQEIEQLLKAKAEDIMSKNCNYVLAEEEVNNLVKKIKRSKLFSFPVVNSDMKVVGIVTVADIISILS